MATPMFYGWYVVIVCFLIAFFGFGMGFYGTGIYLAFLQALHGWSSALISFAITGYYLLSATWIIFFSDAFERFGPRRVVLIGSAALGGGVAGLTIVTAPWQMYAAFLVMSFGWASMSGAAINIIIAPWFERRRGLAVSLALNGASCGGACIVPLLLFFITQFGFAPGVYMAVGMMLVVLVPSVTIILRRHPHELGLSPDGEPLPAHGHAGLCQSQPFNASPWRRTEVFHHINFWTISIPFALGLAAQVGFLTHQIAYLDPLLGTSGAGIAVSLTTMAAVIGRLLTGMIIDRLDRRKVSSANFSLQVIALGAMIVFPTPLALYLACAGFGLGVGNMISLPALIVQQEFPREEFARIISLIVALNQFTFAFGPGALGVIRGAAGSYTASLLLCMLLQSLAAGIILFRYYGPAIEERQPGGIGA
jgi:MFS family permease